MVQQGSSTTLISSRPGSEVAALAGTMYLHQQIAETRAHRNEGK
jgi:hypothetical protein